MRNFWSFLIALVVVGLVSQLLEEQNEQYAWVYVIIIVLGLMIFNNRQFTSFFNTVLRG